jgi:hypothetical protein
VAILGFSVTSIFVYHLITDILNLSPVLKNIAKAVWRPRVHLVLTLILFLFGMYVFAAIGFVYFREYYKQGLKKYCDNIFECFLVTLDKGFKFDGGVGNWLNLRNEGSDDMKSKYQAYDLWRFTYENLLLLLLLIINLNIVSGVIIDTFKSLREEYNAYIEDQTNFCFICGFSKEVIDKESSENDGFEFHIKNEHYQWNYLFYMNFVEEKNPSDHTGLESYIANQIIDEEIDWFPNHRAMMLPNEDEEANENLADALGKKILNKVTAH